MNTDDPEAERFTMEDLDLFPSAAEHLAEQGGTDARVVEVEDDAAGDRLDAWLARAMKLTRTRMQELVTDGHVHYLGPRHMAKLKSSLKIEAGDQFQVSLPPIEELEVQAEDLPIDVIFEDRDILVLNKARGMVVHPAPGTPRGTLVNALLHHVRDLSGIAGVGRPGIVHRLDKDTSGLMVVAKNDGAHNSLTTQFAGRQVQKVYTALVHGQTSSSSTIDMPIGRHPTDRKRMAVVFNGRPAVSEYERLEPLNGYSLLRVRIRTGRTHQIRVHLSWLGHPVAGDPLYCRRDPLELRGQFLHAGHLAFMHPTSGKWLEFDQPLPAALADCLTHLRAEYARDPNQPVTPLDSLQIVDGWLDAASGAR